MNVAGIFSTVQRGQVVRQVVRGQVVARWG
jgi:hypothetical protein